MLKVFKGYTHSWRVWRLGLNSGLSDSQSPNTNISIRPNVTRLHFQDNIAQLLSEDRLVSVKINGTGAGLGGHTVRSKCVSSACFRCFFKFLSGPIISRNTRL